MNMMMARSMPPAGIMYPGVNPVLTSGRVVCVAPFGSYEYDDGEEHATRGYYVPWGEPCTHLREGGVCSPVWLLQI